MPVVIDELTTSVEVRDEQKIQRLVREEVARAMADERRKTQGQVDPADPAASGSPSEGG